MLKDSSFRLSSPSYFKAHSQIVFCFSLSVCGAVCLHPSWPLNRSQSENRGRFWNKGSTWEINCSQNSYHCGRVRLSLSVSLLLKLVNSTPKAFFFSHHSALHLSNPPLHFLLQPVAFLWRLKIMVHRVFYYYYSYSVIMSIFWLHSHLFESPAALI